MLKNEEEEATLKALIKMLHPCYGKIDCLTPSKRVDTIFKSPDECPAGIECLALFGVKEVELACGPFDEEGRERAIAILTKKANETRLLRKP